MAKNKILVVDNKDVYPHAGEGHPELQFPDPINGEMIGGQVAAMRMAMRYRHVVTPWARRQGKTKARQFVIVNEATITSGPYWAGICYPDHNTAFKIADNFRRSWGGIVKNYKINTNENDRWIELLPQVPTPGMAPPSWFTPEMAAKWILCHDKPGERNDYVKIYFWGASHPHYERIQGFPHPFHRVDWDECQQIHPKAYGIVRPMLRDIRGSEWYSGTPWHEGIGNIRFQKLFRMGCEPNDKGWFSMRIPDGSNPHVAPEDEEEVLKTDGEQVVRQTMHAEFLTGEGAVFENIDKVCILPYIKPDDEQLDWVRDIRRENSMPTMQWWVYEPEPIQGHVYGVSIDWARSPKGDFSALTVFNFTTAQQAALFRWRGVSFTDQMEAVLSIQDHYAARELHSDSNGVGLAMSDFMRRRHALGFIAHKFGRDKESYVTRARVMFQDVDVDMIDCPEQKDEFQSFAAHEDKSHGGERVIKYSAIEGEHDDLVDVFLQLAPTLTIVGRRDVHIEEGPPPPIFDKKGMTTLEQFVEGAELPFREEGDEATWDSVVVP